MATTANDIPDYVTAIHKNLVGTGITGVDALPLSLLYIPSMLIYKGYAYQPLQEITIPENVTQVDLSQLLYSTTLTIRKITNNATLQTEASLDFGYDRITAYFAFNGAQVTSIGPGTSGQGIYELVGTVTLPDVIQI